MKKVTIRISTLGIQRNIGIDIEDIECGMKRLKENYFNTKWHITLTIVCIISNFMNLWKYVYILYPSLGFSRQEHWSGLPFPSPIHESEKWKWSRSVVSDSQRPHGLQPTRLLRPWDSPGKSTGAGCHRFLQANYEETSNKLTDYQNTAL